MSRKGGICIAAVVGLLAGLPLAATPDFAASPVLTRYPYLTDMTASGVKVNFATDTASPLPVVKWGTSGGTCQTSTSTVTSHQITVAGAVEYQYAATISGLGHHASYCYRVVQSGVDLLGLDPSPAFTTFASAGTSTDFSFAVFGDWGSVGASGSNPDEAMVLSRVAGSGASFVATVGDNSYPNGSQTQYGDLQHTGADTSDVFGPQFWKQLGKGIPAFPPMGNHGMSAGPAYLTNWPEPAAVGGSAGRYQMNTYCCLDGTNSSSVPSAWYAFNDGQARFYMLQAAWNDSNVGTASSYQVDHDYHWTPSSAEYEWLQSDLAAHASTPLKFAFFHYPLYSDNTLAGPSDTFLEGTTQLEGLLSSNGVAITFTGHAHLYERNLPTLGSMVTYITGGGGGQTLNVVGRCSAFDGYAVGWSPNTNSGSSCNAPKPTSPNQVHHFLLVSVSGTSVTVTPTDEMGNTFDVQTYQE
jgi:hypothetical protein